MKQKNVIFSLSFKHFFFLRCVNNKLSVLTFAHASSVLVVLFIRLCEDAKSTAAVVKPVRNCRMIIRIVSQ